MGSWTKRSHFVGVMQVIRNQTQNFGLHFFLMNSKYDLNHAKEWIVDQNISFLGDMPVIRNQT